MTNSHGLRYNCRDEEREANLFVCFKEKSRLRLTVGFGVSVGSELFGLAEIESFNGVGSDAVNRDAVDVI